MSTNPFEEDSSVSSFESHEGDNTFHKNTSFNNKQTKEEEEEEDSTPIESTWQFLGDLPYKRVELYKNIKWGGSPSHKGSSTLSSLPSNINLNSNLTQSEFKQFMNSTTQTLVASCPNGGPIASVTIPLLSNAQISSAFTTTSIKIMTNAGSLLHSIQFPPPFHSKREYSAADILKIGFTSRCLLVILTRDGLLFTYSLSGKLIFSPFAILQETGNAMEIIDAHIYDGGVAILTANMTSVLVELLDESETSCQSYKLSAAIQSKVVRAVDYDPLDSIGEERKEVEDDLHLHPILDSATSSYYALITPLTTSQYAKQHYISYSSIAVLPRIHTASRHPEVFLGTSSNSVIVCDASSLNITDVNCQERIGAPIVHMKFAPNGRFLACFTLQNVMTVISTNFETKVLDFDTSDGSTEVPNDLNWCGEDSVVLHWKNLGVLMVGPYGDWLRFPYHAQNVHLSAEMDCCRVVTDQGVELLQRVPPNTAAMMRIGSIEPSAMLLDASEAFLKGSPSSDEAAKAIRKTGMLMDAIETCIDAASKEIDVKMQKKLLRAASYGMHFDYKDVNNKGILGGSFRSKAGNNANVRPSEVAHMFVETAKKIRVLNALRDPSIGIAMTLAQFDSIEATGVISRLIAMKRPALATSLATYLQLDEAVRAYARAARAAAFVATDTDHSDSETTDAAIKILNTDVKSPLMNRGGYATVALAASKAGRNGVANLLLTLETNVADKVPGLTSIGLFSDAAAVATKAKDDDLIFHVLLEYEKACLQNHRDANQAQLVYLSTVVNKFPSEAMKLLGRYFASMQEIKHAVNLHNKDKDYATSGMLVAKRSISLPREQDRLSGLQEASRLFAQGTKDNAFLKSCTDDYTELMLEQDRLRRTYGPDVTPKTSSVTNTIFHVLCYAAVKLREANKLLNEADKLARKFKVPDKRLWHTKIRAFAASDQWKYMKMLADSRTKIPISSKYFALAAIKKQRETSEVLWYIQKVLDGEERCDLYMEAKIWKRALDEAKRLGDERRVMNVKSLCNNPEIEQACDRFLASYT